MIKGFYITSLMVILLLSISAAGTNQEPLFDNKDFDNDGFTDKFVIEQDSIKIYAGRTDYLIAVIKQQTGEIPPHMDENTISAKSPPSVKRPKPRFTLALVPNLYSNDVSIIDTTTNTEKAKIPVGTRPRYVAMTGSGKYAYIASDEIQGGIYKVNLQTLSLETTIFLQQLDLITELEISPNDRWLLAGDRQKGKLFIIDTLTDTVLNVLTLCVSCGASSDLYSPLAVSFSADNRFAYVAEAKERNLNVIHLSTQQLVAAFPLQDTGNQPVRDLKGTSDEREMYSAASYCKDHNCFIRRYTFPDNLYEDMALSRERNIPDMEITKRGSKLVAGNICYGSCGGYIDIMDRRTKEVTAMPTSMASQHLTYDEAAQTLWSICLKPGIDDPAYYCKPYTQNQDRVDVVDMGTMERIASIPVAVTFGFPSLSQNGEFFYAVNNMQDVIVVINTKTYNTSAISVGDNPRGVYMQGDNRIKEVVL